MTGPAETASGARAAAPVATRARAPRRLGGWGHRNARWLFPAPAVLIVAAIIVYPIVYTVWMSLQDWFASSLTLPKFIGLANYQKILFGDPRFREAVIRTLYFTALVIAGETVLGVAMALLFNREFWGRGLLRTLAILPMVATPVAIGLVFVALYGFIVLTFEGAFTNLATSRGDFTVAGNLIYFSFATLTTTGYGDIGPVHPFARSLANIEAIIGQIYPATLLARLVTLELARQRGA